MLVAICPKCDRAMRAYRETEGERFWICTNTNCYHITSDPVFKYQQHADRLWFNDMTLNWLGEKG